MAEELTELYEAVGDIDGEFVVDIGCSEGFYGRNLAGRGGRVLAIDHSRAYCRKAERRARRMGVRIALARAVAQNLPVADGSAAAVVMGGTFNEIGDQRVALDEAVRVLRAGGRGFVVSLLAASTAPGRLLQRGLEYTGICFPTLAATNAMFTAAGLTIADQRVEGIAARTFLAKSPAA